MFLKFLRLKILNPGMTIIRDEYIDQDNLTQNPIFRKMAVFGF